MAILFMPIYLIMGLLQISAVIDGVDHAFRIGFFPSFICSIFITYIPFLGQFVGIYGAHNVWGWELWSAAALFFWFVPVLLLMGIFERAWR